MIPRCIPRDSSGLWVVFELTSITGLREWADYIPIQEVTDVAASQDRYNEDGHIPITKLASTTGLTAWVDYTPVDTKTGRADRWRTSADGFIPVVDDTPE
jgi:hypothetical protein